MGLVVWGGIILMLGVVAFLIGALNGVSMSQLTGAALLRLLVGLALLSIGQRILKRQSKSD